MLIPNTYYLGFSLSYFLSWRVSAIIPSLKCNIESGREICVNYDGTTVDNQASAPSTTPSDIMPRSSAILLANPSIELPKFQENSFPNSLTSCYMNGATQFCRDEAANLVKIIPTASMSSFYSTYTDCHNDGTERYCFAPDRTKVEVLTDKSSESSKIYSAKKSFEGHMRVKRHNHDHGHGHSHSHSHGHSHDHSGHSENGAESSGIDCSRHARNYNVNLRIGLLFVILITSAVGVFTPILLEAFFKLQTGGLIFTFIKQFGTGIIIATAFIHLLTHGGIMFANPCLSELQYESTATSITMGGLFLAFLVDYLSHRLVRWQRLKARPELNSVEKEAEFDLSPPLKSEEVFHGHHHYHHGEGITGSKDSTVSLLILEAGIIFHSLLIGVTLVVAADSVFITLFIVIVFHQIFEGLALGARIAAANKGKFGNAKTILLPLAFSFITPLGMAIGIGTLQLFNGNDVATIIVLGTLDSLSAGILIWVGIIDMWAGDWIFGDLANAALPKTLLGMASLTAGFALMGLLGKWA